MYNKQGEDASEKTEQKRKSVPGLSGRRPSQGTGGKYSDFETELKAKNDELEKLKKTVKIRRESEDQMNQVSSFGSI